jgi:hypothetical protein
VRNDTFVIRREHEQDYGRVARRYCEVRRLAGYLAIETKRVAIKRDGPVEVCDQQDWRDSCEGRDPASLRRERYGSRRARTCSMKIGQSTTPTAAPRKR